jgi:hypothetical protein
MRSQQLYKKKIKINYESQFLINIISNDDIKKNNTLKKKLKST